MDVRGHDRHIIIAIIAWIRLSGRPSLRADITALELLDVVGILSSTTVRVPGKTPLPPNKWWIADGHRFPKQKACWAADFSLNSKGTKRRLAWHKDALRR
jgi:hypothetical protein